MKQSELPKMHNEFNLNTLLNLLSAWSRINGILQAVMAHPGRVLTTLTYVDQQSGEEVRIFIIIGGSSALRRKALSSLWTMWKQGYQFDHEYCDVDANKGETLHRVYCTKVA